jgi:two-component sensor histidine kinase
VQVSPIFGADGKPSHLLSISKDITEEWQAAERQRFLTEELQHRGTNMMTTVVSIAKQTFKDDLSRAHLQTFVQRLNALDRTHKLLTDANWRKADIRSIIESALESHSLNGSIRVEGPNVDLGPRQALAFALATNELATNAIKYGALSAPNGRVDISWSETPATDGGRRLLWSWTETGGPTVAPPKRVGFGSRVIKDMLAAELHGQCDVDYAPGGLICKASAPADRLLAS